jgi:hypothetical protein
MLGNVEFIGELFKRKMVGVDEVQLSLNKLLAECEEDMDKIQLTATLAYYLNGLRSPTTLLGINASVTPNFWTARNVLP